MFFSIHCSLSTQDWLESTCMVSFNRPIHNQFKREFSHGNCFVVNRQQERVCPSMYAHVGRDGGVAPVVSTKTDSDSSLVQSGTTHSSE